MQEMGLPDYFSPATYLPSVTNAWSQDLVSLRARKKRKKENVSEDDDNYGGRNTKLKM